MSHGNGVVVQDALDAILANPLAVLAELIINPDDRELHDAFQLLSSINIDPDEALAPSGQVLIEQKLSKAEAM